MSCRTGCKAKNHSSYAECLRDGATRVAFCNSAGGQDYTAQKRWDADLDAYKAARAEGIQPQGTTRHHVEMAKAISDKQGQAYSPDATSHTA